MITIAKTVYPKQCRVLDIVKCLLRNAWMTVAMSHHARIHITIYKSASHFNGFLDSWLTTTSLLQTVPRCICLFSGFRQTLKKIHCRGQPAPAAGTLPLPHTYPRDWPHLRSMLLTVSLGEADETSSFASRYPIEVAHTAWLSDELNILPRVCFILQKIEWLPAQYFFGVLRWLPWWDTTLFHLIRISPGNVLLKAI